MDWIAGLKAVSFDADGTLWDFQGTMHRSLGKALNELEKIDPQAASELTVDEMIRIRDRVARDLK
jgi:phosphoglycolate phosphatase-like HAD superfamily hydrolase